MSDTLDQDLATIGRMLQADWTYEGYWQTYGRVWRESLGPRRWFKSCCGERMYKLIVHSIKKGTQDLPPLSRLREYEKRWDRSICLRCGARTHN